MKQIFILFTLLALQHVSAQISTSSSEKINIENSQSKIATPKPISGMNAFYKYISDNIRTPENEDFPGGKIIVTFFVEIDGSLGEINVLKDIGYGTAQQIKKILKKSPKWKPAEKDGIPVRAQYKLPITIGRNQ